MNYEDHDDLCPMKHEQWPKHPLQICWQCDLISQVREDERTRHDGQSVILARDAEAAVAAAFEDGLNHRDMEWQTRQLAIEEANLNRNYEQGRKDGRAELQAENERWRQLCAEQADAYDEGAAWGRAEAIAGAVKRLEEYLQHDVADGWMTRGKADGILDIVRNVSQ